MEPIVVALGIFTAKAASDCRMQICILGEKILPDLLYLWTNCSSDKVKVRDFLMCLLSFGIHCSIFLEYGRLNWVFGMGRSCLPGLPPH